MCTEDVYTDIYANGQTAKRVRPTFCDRSRRGQLCDNPVVYNHPPRYVQPGEHPQAQYILPPSPRATPRSTTPTHYRSGDESDRSHKSGGGSGRDSGSDSKRKRSSGVYVNGHKVLDLDNRKSSSSSSRPKRSERIVIVDSPPTQRTPPQQYHMPYTAPPSPSANPNAALAYMGIVDPPTREPLPTYRRPVIVDERPRHPSVQIEVVSERRPSNKHHRQPSNESRHSSHASSSGPSDEELRRARRHEEKHRAEEEIKRQKMRARIAAANDEIKRRQPVPIPVSRTTSAPNVNSVPPPPPVAPTLKPALKRSNTSAKMEAGYVRPAVEVPVTSAERERELVEAVQRLEIHSRRRAAEKERRAVEKAEREEAEAQRQRLMERMQPKRRATVGPGNRRHRVLYDDGIYRWE
jgi:hypothetical protein